MKDLLPNKIAPLSLVKRFHLVIFTVLMTLLLSFAILLLYSVVIKASGDNSIPQNSSLSSFDQATIDQVDNLKTSDEPSEPLDLSQGRINPFGE